MSMLPIKHVGRVLRTLLSTMSNALHQSAEIGTSEQYIMDKNLFIYKDIQQTSV